MENELLARWRKEGFLEYDEKTEKMFYPSFHVWKANPSREKLIKAIREALRSSEDLTKYAKVDIFDFIMLARDLDRIYHETDKGSAVQWIVNRIEKHQIQY